MLSPPSHAPKGLPALGRVPGGDPVGVIDIGSNSVRLVVYERLARSPTPLFNEKMLAGLGAGVAETGRLAPAAVDKTKIALRRFAALSRQMRVVDLDVIATSATREAANGAEFLAEVEAICGVPVRLLSGDDEARLAALGIVAGFQTPDGVAGDLGGGSLELTDVTERGAGRGESLLLGGLRLQAASKNSVKAARDLTRRELENSAVIGRLEGRVFYAIGGTWRSLARLHMQQSGYPLHVMHEYRMAPADLDGFLKTVSRGPLESVPGIAIVSKQRQVLLPFGAVLLAEILRAGRPRSVVVSAFGVREGLLYSKLSPEEQAEDPLISAAGELSLLRSRSPGHGEELVEWSRDAFTALGIQETKVEARLRQAACLLADIGWRAHPDYRGSQSLNIIANAAFIGLDHAERVFLALAVYYRHAGLAEEELGAGIRDLAPPAVRERAKSLAAVFRVAYLISGAVEGVLPRTTLRRSGATLELLLPRDLADLGGPRIESRLKQLAGLAGLNSAILIGN